MFYDVIPTILFQWREHEAFGIWRHSIFTPQYTLLDATEYENVALSAKITHFLIPVLCSLIKKIITFVSVKATSTVQRCPDGGIGRRDGLKHRWSNPSRFDPGSGYE